MNALISVIVPVYNAESYLSDCLESLTRQTHRELEILVVDDGSADNSAALCEEWEKKDERIRLIRKENGGVSSARNRGLDEAQGEYVAFVDADDWILPEMLKEQLELLVRENGDMILGGYLAVGEKERKSFRQTCREEKAEGAQPPVSCQLMDAKRYVDDFLLQSCSRCWSILFRREAVGEIRFPEGLSIGEDLLFMARLMPRMKRVLVTEKCGYCYFLNEAGAMLTAFKPSYMDQITCWELAEKELACFGEKARENVQLCLFQAALLVAGKLAVSASFQTEEGSRYLQDCLAAAKESWRKLGHEGRKMLPTGSRIKGMVFLYAPAVYLKLYHIWKQHRLPEEDRRKNGGK